MRIFTPFLAAFLAMPTLSGAPANEPVGPTSKLRQALQQAEIALQEDEPEIAQSRYRTALQEGWLLLGSLAHEAGEAQRARVAFERAAAAALETRRAHLSLALVELQLGRPERAVSLLRALQRQNRADGTVRRLLPRALMAADLVDEAVQEMEELHVLAPDVIENTYALARAYLGQKRVRRETTRPLRCSPSSQRGGPSPRPTS